MWLVWSLVQGIFFLLYSFVGPGDVELCVFISVLNGLPAGAKFLNDAIMADVIDYDEFLTGQRAEATYTMFKGFLPKIAAIPASALPISLLASVGHIDLVNGIVQPQPQSVEVFIKIVIIYIPAALAFTSLAIKMRFPFWNNRQVAQITQGVARHLAGREAEDPCSGEMYRPVMFIVDEEKGIDEEKEASLVDYFISETFCDDMLVAYADKESRRKFGGKVVLMTVLYLALWNSLVVVFLGLTAVTYDFLTGILSPIPVLTVVGFGMSVTGTIFSVLRLMAAVEFRTKISSEPPLIRVETIKKIKQSRLNLRKLKNFNTNPFSALPFFTKKKPAVIADHPVAELVNRNPEGSKGEEGNKEKIKV
jgi:hypothetical protein